MKNLRLLLSLVCMLLVQLTFASHDEDLDGDLSNDPMNPTVINVVNGSNEVCAASLAPDTDFFTITVPAGATLDEIELTSFNSAGVGFLGFASGTTIDPNAGIPGLLGWTHLGNAQGPQLAELGANGGIGFTSPLGPGDYTFWTQETSPVNSTSYCLDFQLTIPPPPVTAIPTMGEWGLMILGLLMLILGVTQIRSVNRHKSLPETV